MKTKIPILAIATAATVMMLLSASAWSGKEGRQSQPILNNRVPDDSLLMILAKPYFHYIQYYDSCAVTCMIGEHRVHRASGDKVAIYPFAFFVDEEPRPRAFMSYANMQDSSRTEYFTLDAQDTLIYYKGLKLTTKYTSTEYLGLDDTIFFISKLVDSTTNTTIAILDTSAVILGDSLLDCAFYHNFAMLGNKANIWKYVRPALWTYNKVALTTEIVFKKRTTTSDNLCRWDYLSNHLYSASDSYYVDLLVALYDSISASGQGKASRGFVVPKTVVVSTNPNPSKTPSFSASISSVYPANAKLLLFDTNGELIWESGPLTVQGGIERTVSIVIPDASSGAYYLVPIIDGQIGIAVKQVITR